jgi:hypothetical protein
MRGILQQHKYISRNMDGTMFVHALDPRGRLTYRRLSTERDGWYRDDGTFLPWEGDMDPDECDSYVCESSESPEDRADRLKAALAAALAETVGLGPAKAAAAVIEALADIGVSGRYRLGQAAISVGPNLYAWLRPALAARGRTTPEPAALVDREVLVGRWRGLPVYASALVPVARLCYRDAFERGAALVVVLPPGLGPTAPKVP